MKNASTFRSASSLVAALLAGLAVGVYAQRRDVSPPPRAPRVAPADGYTFFDPLIDIRNEIRRHYVEHVSDKKLLRGAIRGMMSQLDPYSTYFSPRQWRQFDQETRGKFSGIGARMARRGRRGPFVVISPLENSPAQRAGMLPGDRVLAINGRSLSADSGLRQMETLLSGAPGSSLTVTVLHKGARRPVTLHIVRKIITLHSVKGFRRNANGHWNYWINHRHRIAYVRISAFMSGTASELDHALLPLIHSNGSVHGLILDLRFNPGGLLTSAVAVAQRFLSSGVIVSTHGRTKSSDFVARATPAFTYPDFPVVVLVNQYSASAAEIVSGALKDHHRALLIGVRTFGKGSVQNIVTLNGGRSAIKLTTAYYYLPDGRNIMRKKGSKVWGVDPSRGFNIPMSNAQNVAILEARERTDMLPPSGRNAPPKATVLSARDRQLQRALQALLAQQVFSGQAPAPVQTTQPTVTASVPPPQPTPQPPPGPGPERVPGPTPKPAPKTTTGTPAPPANKPTHPAPARTRMNHANKYSLPGTK